MDEVHGRRPSPSTRTSDQDQWRVLLQHRWGRALLLLAAVALLAIAAMGGFRRAGAVPGSRYPVAGLGERVETGAFALTPLRAWATDAPPGQLPRPGKRYLVLRLRAENLTESAFAAVALLQQDVVWLPDGRSGERKPEPMRRVDDHTLYVALQPGLPVLVDLAWEIPAGEALRKPPTWGVYGRHYVERGYLQGEGDAGWKQGDPQLKLVLPAGKAPPAEEA